MQHRFQNVGKTKKCLSSFTRNRSKAVYCIKLELTFAYFSKWVGLRLRLQETKM